MKKVFMPKLSKPVPMPKIKPASSRPTNEDIYRRFRITYPQLSIDDYRPLWLDVVGNRVGITIWLENGDIIHYFPKIAVEAED